jgi:transposase
MWLERELAAGRSLESLARDAGVSASTVAYWANKYGLASLLAARHAAKGAVGRERLAALVADGLSVRAIARELERSPTTVRHWLRTYGLRTDRARAAHAVEPGRVEFVHRCARHGWTLFVRTPNGPPRCRRCRANAVSRRRRVVKEALVAEFGGACQICGYDRFPGALQFHHVDPDSKRFALSDRGLARSLAKARAEAAKCVLLCANCHAEVEAGVATIAGSRPADNLS